MTHPSIYQSSVPTSSCSGLEGSYGVYSSLLRTRFGAAWTDFQAITGPELSITHLIQNTQQSIVKVNSQSRFLPPQLLLVQQ